MIKKALNFIEKKMVEGKFFQWIFTMLQKAVTSVLYAVYTVCGKVVSLVFRIFKMIFLYPDKGLAVLARRHLAKKTPVENQIMFLTFQGDYTCNPKYIAEELIRENTDYKLIWDVKTNYPTSDYPLELRFVKHNTYEFYKQLAASKVPILWRDCSPTRRRISICSRPGMDPLVSSGWMETWSWAFGGSSWQRNARIRWICFCLTVILSQRCFGLHIGRMYRPLWWAMREMIFSS